MVPIEPRIFHAAARRARPMLVLGLLVAAAGAYLWLTRGPDAVAKTALACGLVIAAVLGRPAYRRIPMLWFDAEGLGARSGGRGRWMWSDIEATWVGRVDGRTFLFVQRTAAARAAAPLGFVARSVATVTRAPDIALPIDMLDQPAVAVATAVEVARLAAVAGSEGGDGRDPDASEDARGNTS